MVRKVEVSTIILPTPPGSGEVTLEYLTDLVLVLQQFIDEERSTRALRGTTLTLTQIPTASTGLESGALFSDSGTVKVVS